MIYWVTNTITSSMRYYRENYPQAAAHPEMVKAYGANVATPCGIACFPGAIGMVALLSSSLIFVYVL